MPEKTLLEGTVRSRATIARIFLEGNGRCQEVEQWLVVRTRPDRLCTHGLRKSGFCPNCAQPQQRPLAQWHKGKIAVMPSDDGNERSKDRVGGECQAGKKEHFASIYQKGSGCCSAQTGLQKTQQVLQYPMRQRSTQYHYSVMNLHI